jgi:YidC/Oxa1 family membrane protein insertase
MTDNKNTILAIVLSVLVLIGWQYYFGSKSLQKQNQETAQQSQQHAPGTPGAAPAGAQQTSPQAGPTAPGQSPAQAPQSARSREEVLKDFPRVAIETPNLTGSIALKGGRIDDLSLVRFRETVDPTSPPVVLLAPSGSPHPFFAQYGWTAPAGVDVKLPNNDTEWRQEGSGALGVGRPVTLVYDNGAGLMFRRTISVDDKYMFTIKNEVVNKSGAPVTLYPYGLISRHGTPPTLGYYILHEGFIGFLGDTLQAESYAAVEKAKELRFNVVNGWLGFTDKNWAAVLVPDPKARIDARYTADTTTPEKIYTTTFFLDQQTIPDGGTTNVSSNLFAGAKEVAVVGMNFPFAPGGYNAQLGLNHFDLLIDWGWFYFITKPLFLLIDWLYKLVGNFGIAILMVTVIIKAIFFPLANKSYVSMAKMKNIQPQMAALRERFPDDKVKQQQEMMELYKREKINPVAGCLPIALQIPVFFALYKVLFVTIEMRHAPFFGWIHDLSAPDPTTVFNLFGALPFDPSQVPMIGHYLMLGAWPLIMGVTMWVQMKLNPAPPDPTQKMIFDWMPVIFTFMLANFSAGLVIYWAWNNTLSVLQQSVIMRRNGAKIELFDNIRSTFARKKADASS